MARQGSQSPLTSPAQTRAKATRVTVAAEVGHDASGVTATVLPKTRQIHETGGVNFSAYFSAEGKASLRLGQEKTGYNVKVCLAEAPPHLFRTDNVPVSLEAR